MQISDELLKFNQSQSNRDQKSIRQAQAQALQEHFAHMQQDMTR